MHPGHGSAYECELSLTSLRNAVAELGRHRVEDVIEQICMKYAHLDLGVMQRPNPLDHDVLTFLSWYCPRAELREIDGNKIAGDGAGREEEETEREGASGEGARRAIVARVSPSARPGPLLPRERLKMFELKQRCSVTNPFCQNRTKR